MTENTDTYRDHIATVDQRGKRIWLYPKKPQGAYTRAREIVSMLLLLFFFAAPFIKINQQPLLLFNIPDRKFAIFGMIFWPQDIYLFVITTILLIIFIVLFTVVFGRLWCGWACPQTVFMEMVFRKIEYRIEGDAHQQKKLNQSRWTARKIFKKTIKHLIFYAISFVIGNTFLAYIIGIAPLIKIITDPPAEHLPGLLAMILFSAVFYWVFAFFREQVCTMVCPYGRLQSVLLDRDSIVVSYDFKRGEPRGKFSRTQLRGNLGDCIDCRQCLDVCPTGIDIRNGTQLECINCTACMDACNAIMKKINFPAGLIRYASYNDLVQGAKLKLTPRLKGYSIVLMVLLICNVVLLVGRNAFEITIMRVPGSLYQETADGNITNLYNLKIINKSSTDKPITVKLKSPSGELKIIGGELWSRQNKLIETVLLLEINRKVIKFNPTPVYIDIFADNQQIKEIRTSFIAPEIKSVK
jgi:cytochrome c oxidase accessory protein FixG